MILIALTAFFAVGVIIISGGTNASADERVLYGETYISGYSVCCDIGNDRKIGFTEDITVNF